LNLAGWTPQEMTLKAPLAMHIHFPRLRTNAFDEVPQDEEAAKEAAKNYTKQIDKLRDVLKDAQAYAKASAAHVKRVDREPDPRSARTSRRRARAGGHARESWSATSAPR